MRISDWSSDVCSSDLEIKTLLDKSPPETAVPLPGTPWEVVPVQGRAPMAYVSAAASPNIEALSLYCEGGKPYMAMLLSKPSADNAMTMTRSEERRVGKECGSPCRFLRSPFHYTKKQQNPHH